MSSISVQGLVIGLVVGLLIGAGGLYVYTSPTISQLQETVETLETSVKEKTQEISSLEVTLARAYKRMYGG